MKAEHRKELETNILADRVGRFVQKVKTRPQGRTFLYVFLAIVVVLVLFIFTRMRMAGSRDASELWTKLEDGARPYIVELAGGKDWVTVAKNSKDDPFGSTNAGKAARFQVAWYTLWEEGIKFLGAHHQMAMVSLERAELMYSDLAEACKGDHVWEPEAMYNLAVIEETRAVQDREYLRKAREKYEELANHSTYKDGAYGKLAASRAEKLKQGSPEYDAIAAFYQDFQNTHKIPGKQQLK